MGVPVGTAPGAGSPETDDWVDEGAALDDEAPIMVDELLEDPPIPPPPIMVDEPDCDPPIPDELPIVPLEADAGAVETVDDAPAWVPEPVDPALPPEDEGSETVESAWRGTMTAADADNAPASVRRGLTFMLDRGIEWRRSGEEREEERTAGRREVYVDR